MHTFVCCIGNSVTQIFTVSVPKPKFIRSFFSVSTRFTQDKPTEHTWVTCCNKRINAILIFSPTMALSWDWINCFECIKLTFPSIVTIETDDLSSAHGCRKWLFLNVNCIINDNKSLLIAAKKVWEFRGWLFAIHPQIKLLYYFRIFSAVIVSKCHFLRV